MAASTVGSLIVELRASTASFASDLGRAKQISFNSAKEIERSFKVMGTALVGALTAAAGAATALAIRSIDTADKMGKMAQAAGVSVEQFSGFAYAAKLSDVSTDQLSTSLIALAKNLEKSNQQTLQGKAAHSALGTLFKGNIPAFQSTAEAFTEVSKRLAELPDPIQRTALATQILGKSGAALIPMTKGLQAAIAEARELGIVVSGKTAADAEKFNDTITRLKTVVDAFGFRMAEALLPMMQSLANLFLDNAKNAASVEKQMGVLVGTIKVMATAVAGLYFAWKQTANAIAAVIALSPAGWFLSNAQVAEILNDLKESGEDFSRTMSAIWDKPTDATKEFGRTLDGMMSNLSGAPAVMKDFAEAMRGIKVPDLKSDVERSQDAIEAAAEAARRLAEEYRRVREHVKDAISSLRLQMDSFGQSVGAAAALKAIREGASKVEATIIGQLSQQVSLMQKAAGLMPQPKPLAPQLGPDLAPPELGLSGVDFRDIEFLTDAEKAANNLIVPFEVLSRDLGIISDRFKELRPLGQELQDSLGSLFEQAIFHADSFVDALGRIAQAIAAMALRMLVIQPLLTSLGGLFGATGSLPLTPGRGGISLAGFGGLAAGGPIFGPSIVGERGPELFVPRTSGVIIPNDKLFGRDGGNAQQVVNNFHFDNVTDADSFRRSKGQMGAWFQRQLAIAHGRNG